MNRHIDKTYKKVEYHMKKLMNKKTKTKKTATPIAKENPFFSSPAAAIRMFANVLSSGLYSLKLWSARCRAISVCPRQPKVLIMALNVI